MGFGFSGTLQNITGSIPVCTSLKYERCDKTNMNPVQISEMEVSDNNPNMHIYTTNEGGLFMSGVIARLTLYDSKGDIIAQREGIEES